MFTSLEERVSDAAEVAWNRKPESVAVSRGALAAGAVAGRASSPANQRELNYRISRDALQSAALGGTIA